MKPITEKFREKSSSTLHDLKIQKNLSGLYSGFYKARLDVTAVTENWEQMQDQARLIKEHTLNNLHHYLEMLESKVVENGGNVHFADTATDASNYILNLAKARGVKTVVKSKSMLSEEMSLNQRLEDEGIEPVETDLGEYIVQLAEETPYHIIAPAIHKSSGEVAELFSEKIGTAPGLDIEDLTEVARKQLRQKFIEADMGITGGNFLVADTGTLTLVTNEGNGRMCTSLPKIHVAVVGMEKVIPSMADLGLFLRLLIRSATGQWMSSYVTTTSGPKKEGDIDGPEEFHLVIVDNGRSDILANKELREALYCLRCGACLNACPVYRKVGGHSYGWVYPGPIGAVVTPMLTGLSKGKDLPFASSLCGACKEACPVKIDIPRMLLYMRSELSEGKDYPEEVSSSIIDRITYRIASYVLGNAKLSKLLHGIGSKLAKVFMGNRVPLPSSWSSHRKSPDLPNKTFTQLWDKYRSDGE